MVAAESKPKIFYGWWIVLASTIAHIFSGGFYFYGFSTFFMPLVTEFGWSRAAISGAFSMSRIEGGLLGPIGGFLVDKFGPRKMMFLGLTIMGAGFVWFSRIDSLLSFYLVFILCVAAGSTLGIHQAGLVSIANWFRRKRSMAMGIGMSGIGLGGILVPVLGWLIGQYGWRLAAFIIGLTILITGVPLALVMRRRPEEYGYLPDGEARETSIRKTELDAAKTGRSLSPSPSTDRADPKDIDFTPGQALRTKVFWLLILIFGIRQFVVSAVAVHQIPFLIGLGISSELAAAILGSIAIISVLGRLGFGRMADIIEKRYVNAICLALIALGCLILANAQTFWHVIAFLIIYSPAYGGGAVLMNAIRAEYFGRQYFGTIMGLMDFFQMFGMVLGSVFAGYVFDITESYRLAFITFAIMAAIVTVLMLWARRPASTPAASH